MLHDTFDVSFETIAGDRITGTQLVGHPATPERVIVE